MLAHARVMGRQLSAICVLLGAIGLPLGTAPPLVFLGLAVIFAAVSSGLENWRCLAQEPLFWLCLILFGFITLSSLWSPAPFDEWMESWSRYRRWLYVPLLALALGWLRGHDRLWAGFSAAALFSSVITLLVVFGVLEWLTGLSAQSAHPISLLGMGSFKIPARSDPSFGHTHIAASTFIVLAAHWSVLTFLKTRRWFYLAAAALLCLTVLSLQSRTGYVLLVLAVVVWARMVFQQSSFAGLRRLMGTVAAVVLAALMAGSPVLERSQQAWQDVRIYFEQPERRAQASQAIRLDFWVGAFQMVPPEKILMGQGVGGYAQAYRDLRGREPLEDSKQPHSEYLAMYAQTGLIGLLLFGLILLRAAWLARSDPFALGALGALATTGLFNSVMWNLEQGHLLALLLAWILSGATTRRSY